MLNEIKKIREGIVKGRITVDEVVSTYKKSLAAIAERLLSVKILSNEEFEMLKELLMICIDVYAYSSSGEVIIPDRDYDELMNHYIVNGGSLISRSDKVSSKTAWKFVKHEFPGIVGTIKKAYDYDEIAIWYKKYSNYGKTNIFRIAPKYDGISSAIKITKIGGEAFIKLGVTRNDGYEGQDVTEVVRAAWNSHDIEDNYCKKLSDGETVWIKTELVIATNNFNELNDRREKDGVKPYANRRSATSGIVNSPKNLKYADAITIIPLAAHFTERDEIIYEPLLYRDVLTVSYLQLMDDVELMLDKIRGPEFPIRVDGVVIYPMGDGIVPNYDDIMDHAMAYKVNTKQNFTIVDYGYVSVGRLGRAVPMLHVLPVDVNETIVTDASLGSFDKFASMDLHEGERVVVYSAGDVIPQVKIPEIRHYNQNAPLITLSMYCPYCKTKFTRKKNTYSCTNEKCIRVKSGKIANFIDKLKVKDVSDKKIIALMDAGLVREIPDIFDLSVEDISKLEGYGEDSANIIVREFTTLKNREVPISEFLGAVGMYGISTKKCRVIIRELSFDEIINASPKELYWKLTDINSIGPETAKSFIEFLENNGSLIMDLMDKMNIVNDAVYKGNVVFTGFRNKDLESRFNDLGYELSDNVNGKTILVIDKSFVHDSTKCKAAKAKNIPIYHLSEVDDVIGQLEEE